MANVAQVTVRLLDKEYQIACPEDGRDELLRAADFLNARMKEIRDSGRVVGLDRIAVMAALNLAHDFLQVEDDGGSAVEEAAQRLRLLNDKMSDALGREHPLPL